MRRRQVMLLSFLITLDLAPAIPAHADPGDIKTSSSKTSKAPPLDDPAFTHRLGYQGQIYEDRHGVCNLTIHTSGSMVGVTHVEGDVTANFTISPLQGTGVVYREHAAGNLLIINGEDIPHPPHPSTNQDRRTVNPRQSRRSRPNANRS